MSAQNVSSTVRGPDGAETEEERPSGPQDVGPW